MDDVVIGGVGAAVRKSIGQLRQRFLFRKWKSNQVEMCGSRISQDGNSKEIFFTLSTYALRIRKVSVPARARSEEKATEAVVTSLQACDGADFAFQVNMSQHSMSDPRVRDCRHANNVVRRAVQHHDFGIRILPNPLRQLRWVLHSDAAFQNCRGGNSQAEYVMPATDDRVAQGEMAPWSLLVK